MTSNMASNMALINNNDLDVENQLLEHKKLKKNDENGKKKHKTIVFYLLFLFLFITIWVFWVLHKKNHEKNIVFITENKLEIIILVIFPIFIICPMCILNNTY